VQFLSSNIIPLFWVAVLAVVTLLAMRLLASTHDSRAGQASTVPTSLTLTQRPILTPAEATFFQALEVAVGKHYTIFPQLPLWTLIQPEPRNSQAARTFTNRISLKRVDFVLVDPNSLKPHAVIELDDRSHQQETRQKRDAFVATVFEQAGIKLVRIRAAATYNPQTIRSQLGLNTLENIAA
jgi:very-short-patch-repair endonuclease